MTDLNQGVMKNSEAGRQTTIRTERRHILALNKCCFCVPLRTGCLIFAYSYLIATLANFIVTVISIVSIAMFLLKVDMEPQLIPYIVLHVIKLLLVLAALPCNVLLLIGLHKEKRDLVKIFIIFQSTFIVIYVLEFVGYGAAGYLDWQVILGESIAMAVSVYHLLVMWSQYVKMCENKEPRQGQMYLEARLADTTAA